jgi:hypothetical protein
MKKYVAMLMVVFLMVVNGPISAYAAWQYSAEVTGSDWSSFGQAVGLVRTTDGDFLAVGNNTDTDIYKRNESTDQWDQKATIPVASSAIALDQDRIAVSDSSGNVYTYTRDNAEGSSWTLENDFSGDFTGSGSVHSIDLEGNLLAIAHEYMDNSGRVMMFHYYDPDGADPLGWYIIPEELQRNTICTEGGRSCDWDKFGSSVSIQGNNVLVGAQEHDYYYDGASYTSCSGGAGNACGAAYIYRTTDGGVTWENDNENPAVELYPVDAGTSPASNDQFGHAVSMEDDYLAVSSRWGDALYADGTVTVFERSGSDWVSPEEFQHSDPSGYQDHFGAAVDMEGDYMIVGTPEYNQQQGGKIYVFELSGGSWDNEIFDYKEPGGPYWGINLGTDIAMDGNDYYAAAGNPKNTAPDTKIFFQETGGGGEAVPEFSDYMYILTIIIAFGLMFKFTPKMNSHLQPR